MEVCRGSNSTSCYVSRKQRDPPTEGSFSLTPSLDPSCARIEITSQLHFKRSTQEGRSTRACLHLLTLSFFFLRPSVITRQHHHHQHLNDSQHTYQHKIHRVSQSSHPSHPHISDRPTIRVNRFVSHLMGTPLSPIPASGPTSPFRQIASPETSIMATDPTTVVVEKASVPAAPATVVAQPENSAAVIVQQPVAATTSGKPLPAVVGSTDRLRTENWEADLLNPEPDQCLAACCGLSPCLFGKIMTRKSLSVFSML